MIVEVLAKLHKNLFQERKRLESAQQRGSGESEFYLGKEPLFIPRKFVDFRLTGKTISRLMPVDYPSFVNYAIA